MGKRKYMTEAIVTVLWQVEVSIATGRAMAHVWLKRFQPAFLSRCAGGGQSAAAVKVIRRVSGYSVCRLSAWGVPIHLPLSLA
jgi:hypothetical protein